MITKSLCAAALGILIPALAPAAPAYSLAQAVGDALARNPALKESTEKLNELDAQVTSAKSVLLPGIAGTVDATVFRDSSLLSAPKFGGDAYDQWGASVQLKQRLYQFGTFSRIEAARKDRAIGGLGRDIAARDLTRSVIQAYFLAITKAKSLGIVEEQIRIADDYVKTTGKRSQIGRGQTIDSLQAQTQWQLLVGQRTVARNSVLVAQQALARLLGAPAQRGALELPKDFAIVDFKKLKTELAKAGSGAAELKRDELAVVRADDARTAVRGDYLPSLGLIGNYDFGAYGASRLFSRPARSWSVGVALAVPIFTGFNASAQVRVAESQRAQAEFRLQSTNDDIWYQQEATRRTLDSAEEAIESAREAMGLAEKTARQAASQYRLATIDFLQYLTIQQALAQARLSLASAEQDYVAALTDFYAAAGKPMGDLVSLLDPGK